MCCDATGSRSFGLVEWWSECKIELLKKSYPSPIFPLHIAPKIHWRPLSLGLYSEYSLLFLLTYLRIFTCHRHHPHVPCCLRPSHAQPSANWRSSKTRIPSHRIYRIYKTNVTHLQISAYHRHHFHDHVAFAHLV